MNVALFRLPVFRSALMMNGAFGVMVLGLAASSSAQALPAADLTSPAGTAAPVSLSAALYDPLLTPDADSVVMEQVTSVSQLSDVKPTDWAFQALQSLVERYGCIAGYPDKTYRGNRALTRYEFAAGLNACLDRVNELIAASTANLVKKEDLMALKKLQEQFAAELATLRGRVTTLETKTALLEKQQFSTTTKLSGLGWFNITGATSGKDVRYEGAPGAPADGRFAGVRDALGAPVSAIAAKPKTTASFLTW
jgi:Carbohydrate-selective porin, OprB family/S-layer homology domain